MYLPDDNGRTNGRIAGWMDSGSELLLLLTLFVDPFFIYLVLNGRIASILMKLNAIYRIDSLARNKNACTFLHS